MAEEEASHGQAGISAVSSTTRDGKVLRLICGGHLGYAEYGSPAGFPILYFHGLPGSRFEATSWDGPASKHNIRLVAPDRPGMGLSTRKIGRRVVEYPEDIKQLVDHLDLKEFGVMGVSGGGIYALACAAQRDNLPGLRRVGVVAGLGPRDLTQAGMNWIQKMSFVAMDWVPGKLVGWLWEMMIGKAARNPDRSVLEKAVRKSVSAAPEVEKEVLLDDSIIVGFTESLRGAFAQGSGGYVDDATLSTQPWGFDLTSIPPEVTVKLWYGSKDDLAPASVGRALQEKIAGSSCTVFDGDGHARTALKHQDDVLEALLGR